MSTLVSVIASVSSKDGGTTSTVLALGSQLRELGFRNIIETTDADGYHARLPDVAGSTRLIDGAPVCFHALHQPRRLKASLGHAWHIWSRTRNADVVHVHGLYLACTVVGAATCWIRKIPYVVQPHGGLEPYHQVKSHRAKRAWDVAIGDRILKNAHAIVCASHSEAANVSARGFGNTLVISHGVRRADGCTSEGVSAQIASWGVAPVVLFLGRLTRKKHPELLIDAWGRLPDGIGRLVIVGPDDDWTTTQLRQRADAVGRADSVDFLGALEGPDKWAVLNRADLFCLPSESENFGVTVPEALVAGTACIVTGDVATAEDVRRSGAGWVLDELDPKAWASQLATVLVDSEDLAQRGLAAKSFARDIYDWREVASRYVALYEAAIKSAKE